MKDKQALIVWRFSDGRAGHDSQSQGLVNALSNLTLCSSYDLVANAAFSSLCRLLSNRFPPGAGLPEPHLIIGAGHGTHLSMLCANRVRGGKTVVLMKPSLPTSFFDYCLIPEHDEPRKSDNIIPTQGAVNAISASNMLDKKKGLILIGGTSDHFHWNNTELEKQLQAILRKPDKDWTISDSPRTPAETRTLIDSLRHKNLNYMPYDTCEKTWLQTQLQIAGTIWVSQDSISMIYEALSAGGAVGVLNIQAKKDSRVVKATRGLIEQNKLTSFNAWESGAELAANQDVLREAARCAELLLERLGEITE